MKGKKKFIIVILFWVSISVLPAQESISTTGGDFSGNGNSVSFSIGQLFYNSDSGKSGSVSSGIQQAFEISVETEISQARGISLQFSVFPNPTTDIVSLKVEDFKIENLSYQLYNMSGKLLETEMVVDIETRIDMIQFVPAIYFLKVTQHDKIVKSFKIIKN